ncbi:MAG: hypothetical protein A2Y62_01005 [Candidatus Fischerbacteria bacterium RBG_13_37_8]|uniref:Bulb-type lectin domain-containing protein n=1 Tax=Candidatus Fischerbacteria bacterium RBG_13_37_8 TaxID=1817863 RepID=A0A1F5VSW5_9BACT|nr:MAG: hypothetical protein A2Y62_01005 [Candidatus Fischerbacteria bacterium RBG_13_37_8]
MKSKITIRYFSPAVLLLLMSLSILIPVANAQTTFSGYFSGSDEDEIYSIAQTSNGDYILSGSTKSFGAGGSDILVIKLNGMGNILWKRTIGTTSDEYANEIVETEDGNYVLVAYQRPHPLIIKLDKAGNILWRRYYGLDHYSWGEDLFSVNATTDGGVITAGYTEEECGTSSYFGILIIKLESSGNITWRRLYCEEGYHAYAKSIIQTSDGGYILAGFHEVWFGGSATMLIMKLNSSGNIQWRRLFSSSGWNAAESIAATPDGGYIVTGTAYSDIEANDVIVIKLNSSGNILWRRTFGTINFDGANAVVNTNDGNYLVLGSIDPYVSDYVTDDAVMIKLNSSGGIVWRRAFGTNNHGESAYFGLTASDGNYVIAGGTTSFATGVPKGYVLKVNTNGIIPGCTYFTTPALTVAAPSLSASAPVFIGSAPVLIGGAPSFTVTAPAFTIGTICQ